MRIFLDLDDTVADALVVKAEAERRRPRDQAALIVEQELRRAGLLDQAGRSAEPSEVGANRG